MSHRENDAALMHVFDFTADDLAANRSGHTTQRQRKALLWRNIKTTLFALLAWVLIALIVVLCGPVITWFELGESFDPFDTPVVAIILGGLALIVGAFVLRRWVQYVPVILRGQVGVAEGRVALTSLPGNTVRYQVKVGDERFELDRSTYETLTRLGADRTFYRVYYLAGPRTVLSAEALPPQS